MKEWLKKNKLASVLLTGLGVGGTTVGTALPWDKLLPSLVTKSHLEVVLEDYKKKDGIPEITLDQEPIWARDIHQKLDIIIDQLNVE